MNLKSRFEMAAGSIVGSDHLKLKKNCQDAYIGHYADDMIIAIVADGCGQHPYSEVGAHEGARMLKNILVHYLTTTDISKTDFPKILERVKKEMQSRIHALADYDTATMLAYYSFTLVGAVILPDMSYVFSFGDGVWGVNGDIKIIGPYPRNEPPYIMYGNLPSSSINLDPKLLDFQIQAEMPTDQISHLLVGTDGVEYLERIGPLSQFWEEDIYFTNPFAIRKKLFLINSESQEIDWIKQCKNVHTGPLKDDTTLIVIRKI